MDEVDHLLSSLSDHLDAADAKALCDDVDSEIGAAQSIARGLETDDLDHDELHDRIEDVLDVLDDIEDGGTENEEAERHLEAAKRAAERVLDR